MKIISPNPGAAPAVAHVNIKAIEERIGAASVFRCLLDLKDLVIHDHGQRPESLHRLWSGLTLLEGRYLPARSTQSMTNASHTIAYFDIPVAKSVRAPSFVTICVVKRYGEAPSLNYTGSKGYSFLWSLVEDPRSHYEYPFPVNINWDTSEITSEFLTRAMFKHKAAINPFAQMIVDELTLA